MNNRTWTIAEAKRDFARGLLSAFEITADPMQPGQWFLVLKAPKLGEEGVLLAAYPRQVRVFKTADAAVHAAQQIGFTVHALKG